MPELNSAAINPVQIFNQLWPDQECPKCLALDMDFNAADEYTLNLLLQNTRGFIRGIQACYFDNQQNTAGNVNFEASDTGMRMFFRAGWQGFRPMFLGQPMTGKFTCLGGNGVFRILLTNTPIMPAEWDAT